MVAVCRPPAVAGAGIQHGLLRAGCGSLCQTMHHISTHLLHDCRPKQTWQEGVRQAGQIFSCRLCRTNDSCSAAQQSP